MWRSQLKNNKGPIARIMAGGSGAGKSTATRALGDTEDIATVLDGNLSKWGPALERIKEVKESGKSPEIIYIYRDPVDAFKNGVIKRMMSSSNPDEIGRVVPVRVHVENHTGALDVAKRMAKSENAEFFRPWDNSLGRGNSRALTLEKLNKLKMPSDLKDRLEDIVERYFKEGKITKEQYDSLLG